MKTLILAVFAALTIGTAVIPAAMARDFHNGSTIAGDAAATRSQQTGSFGGGD